MDTVVTLTIYGNTDNATTTIEEAFKRITQIEDIMSAHKESSELYKLNKNAYANDVPVSDELFDIIKKSLEISTITDGAFDITLGQISELWNFNAEIPKMPTELEVEALLVENNYKNVVLNDSKKTIRFKNDKISLDLGGIAKGYATNEVKEIFLKNSISSAIIDLGGNVYVLGINEENGSKFKCGIVSPFAAGEALLTLPVSNKSVVTSGNYERYFIVNGTRYHHILDSTTGFPVKNDVSSVTIIGEDSLYCDALSTAVFVMGCDLGLQFIEKMTGFDVVIITNDSRILTNLNDEIVENSEL